MRNGKLVTTATGDQGRPVPSPTGPKDGFMSRMDSVLGMEVAYAATPGAGARHRDRPEPAAAGADAVEADAPADERDAFAAAADANAAGSVPSLTPLAIRAGSPRRDSESSAGDTDASGSAARRVSFHSDVVGGGSAGHRRESQGSAAAGETEAAGAANDDIVDAHADASGDSGGGDDSDGDGSAEGDHSGDVGEADGDDLTDDDSRGDAASREPEIVVPAGQRFRDVFSFDKKLGSGAFATVYSATHTATGTTCAVKAIRRDRLGPDDMANLASEVQIHRTLDHKAVARLLGFHSDDEFFYMRMELLQGGELLDRIVAKSTYTEVEARDVIYTLAQGIAYCHRRGVVHRDIKPENLLYASEADDSALKLVDFGFAMKSDAGASAGVMGTPMYIAPEMLQGTHEHGTAVDIWSLGVIFYILLAGYPPFHHDDEKVLYELIKNSPVPFDDDDWEPVSKQARDLVTRMLDKDPDTRLTAAQMLRHPFLSKGRRTSLGMRDLTRTRDQMKRFNARRRLKSAMNAVKTTVRMKLLLGGVKKAASMAAMPTLREAAAREAASAAFKAGGNGTGGVAGAGGGVSPPMRRAKSDRGGIRNLAP